MPISLEKMENVTDRARPARNRRRLTVEQVLVLARHLNRRDQILVDQVYRQGVSIADAARLVNRPAKVMQRRLRKVIQRLGSPTFLCLVARGDLLPRETRKVADMVICQGMSLRRAASSARMSLYETRQHVQRVRVLASAHEAILER